jgi:hypothetical protein
MPRKKKSEEPLDPPEMNDAHEAIPTIPSPTRGSHMRVVKEFDLRAAHHAWKERNGIEDGW